MKDIDKLKEQWRKIDISAPEAPKGKSFAPGEMPHSIRDRICRMQKRMMLVAAAGIICSPAVRNTLETPGWFIACYCGYFVIALILNVIQFRMLRNADFSSFTTIHAINFIERFAVTRARFRSILICLAVPMVVTMLCIIDHENEPATIISAAAGCVIGVILGLVINNRFKRNINLMRKYLSGE